MNSLFRAALIAGLIAGLLAGAPAAIQAQNNRATAVEQLKTYRFGGDDAALNTIMQWVREVRDNPTQRAEAAQALAGVLRSEASFDAKQFACRQLVFIAGDSEVPALVSLLKDETLAHYAALALAQLPGTATSVSVRHELPQSSGKARLEIIKLLGHYRDQNSIEALAAFLKAEDEPLVIASAEALGKIGTARAATALRESYQNATGARRLTLGRALLACADALREAGDGTAANTYYETLQADAALPLVSAGALRGLVLARSEKSLPLLLNALAQDGTPQQKAAAALSRDVLKGEQGARATQLLANRLAQLSPQGQSLLLAALGERGDAGAAPAVAALLNSDDAEVRAAAATAIGTLGNATTVPLLLNLAATGSKEQREVARTSLLRLKGQAIDDKLLASLDKAVPAQKVEIIGALQARRVMASVPRLLPDANNPQPEVRRATLLLLRDMAEPSATPALLDLLIAAAPEQRAALLDTIAEVARRGDEAQRTAPILARLSANKKTADKADLLVLLGRVGGANALETLRKATTDSTPEIRLAAIRALSNWNSDEPGNDLLQVAQKAPDEKSRLIAARGYIRLIGLSTTRPATETLKLLQQASSLDKSPEAIRSIIAGVSKLKTLEALNYASGFLKDDAVRGEAELAVVEIARGTLGAWREASRAAAEPIAKNSTNENARKGAQAILDLSDKLGDFVTAWEVSPAYEKAGATCTQLFDIPFGPEDSKDEIKNTVPWRVMPAATSAEQPWLLDLLALHGGEQKVAYLRTAVWSDKERDLILESGSDDGTKAWWNGQIVLSQNAQRAVAPGQDKTKLSAKSGWNELLLKITQNNMGWGTVARFTNPDGSPATGLRFAIPSAR